jgi:hypothetical protein
VLNLQMAPSTLQESVTVTAEAPLLDMAGSSLGGNIDAKQMSDLPVQGRDWMSLALLARAIARPRWVARPCRIEPRRAATFASSS